MSTTSAEDWSGLIDDAAVFPPGSATLTAALAAWQRRSNLWYDDLVGSFVVTDAVLGDLARMAGDPPPPVSVVLTGGAGAVAGPLELCARRGMRVHGLEVALRDLDDLPTNARRVAAAVDAALAAGTLDEETRVHVELPMLHEGEPTTGWLAAADVIAEAALHAKFRTGGVQAHFFPAPETLAAAIGAALDRELPFKCTAGLHRAIRHTTDEGVGTMVDHHGFLNVLAATRASLDGADVAGVAEVLAERRSEAVLEALAAGPLAGARRWFTSFGSCNVIEPVEDLVDLGLLEPEEGGAA